MTTHPPRLVVLALVLCVSSLALTVATALPASAAWSPPSLMRSIGGDGEPAIFAWGIQYNPVSNEMLVGDYLNWQIRRYDMNGNLLGSFFRPNADGQPYSLAVDPRNGDILVPELADGGPRGVVARYDKNGVFLNKILLSGMTSGNHYHVWLTVDSFGNIWVQDAHYWNNSSTPPKIREFSPTGSTSGCLKATSGTYNCRNFGTWGTGGSNLSMGIGYGIAMDASNNIYVDDSTNKEVHVFSTANVATQNPGVTWVRDIGGPGDGVGQFSSDLRGVAIDKVHGWLYVNDSDANQVEKFTLTGTPLTNWGANGSGPGQFADGGRQLTVGPDGDVWDADYGNFRFMRFTPNGTLKGIYPDPAAGAPVGSFSQPRGVAIDNDTGKIYVADTWAERFQIFLPDGSAVASYGQRNSLAPYGFDYPRGIAFDQDLNRLWVTNTRAHNIRRYNADASYIDTLGSEQNDSSANGFFRWPVSADFFNGNAYVADYNSGVVKRLNPTTGAELSTKSMNNNGVAVDPSTGNVYVVSWVDDKVTVLNPTLSTVIRTFGSNGSTDGKFQNPWGITIANGVVYVTDTQLSRVQAFDLNGVFLGKWGGYGTGPYQFSNPGGITHDAAGNLYIADSANDRIQVYSTTVPKPTGDNRKPVVTITSPSNGGTVPAANVRITGTATDTPPFGVAKVEVSVKDTDTNLWWNQRTGTWGATQEWNQAPAMGASITNMTYAFTFNGSAYNGHYHAEVRGTDISSIASVTIPTVDFSTAGSPGDKLPPLTSITAPVIDAAVPAGPVTIQGSAGDNVGVSQVQVSIMDRNTNRMFDPGTGTFVNGPKIWIPATVAAPGSLETTWSYVFPGGAAGSGSYYVLSRAFDAAGNSETDSPFTRYTVAGVSDTVAPDTSITAPTSGQAVPAGTVGLAGTATDNVGVASVAVSIRDDGTNMWWNGSTWVGSQQWLGASVFSPGAPSTGWSYGWASPGPGAFTAFARSTDTGANVDGSPASRAFTVLPPDTTIPTTTISSPVNNSTANPPIATAGTAADDVGVASVRVAIRDNATLQWWNGSGWGAAGSYVQASLDTPGGTSTGWSYPFDPGVAGNYGIQVKAVDSSGNVGANTAWRNFTITLPGSDSTGPTIAFDTPTYGQILPFGAVNVSGSSADATGVASVRVSIQNSATSQWWNGSGWVAANTFVSATLDTPGGTSTGYSYTFAPGVEGNYAVRVRAVDTLGNLGSSTGLRPFTIQPIFVDTIAPTATVTAPLNNSTHVGVVVMAGTATDDVGVTEVRVYIKNAANQWWNGSTWGTFTFVTATLDDPGALTTGWTYSFSPVPATGYGFQVRAMDAAANLGDKTTWRAFTIT